jgi:protein-tyrosine phosphatase
MPQARCLLRNMIHPNRNLNFPHLLNARDLGGCVTLDGSQTRWKSLVRADELARLTPAGIQALLDYGVRTVIDLRWPTEAKARPSIFQLEPGHVHYRHISLLGRHDEGWRLLRPKATKEMWNCVVLDYAKNEIREVMQSIAHAAEGLVLFHCESGKDRTGIIAALLLALVDVEPHVIAQDYAITTDNLRAAYLAANPAAIDATLERVHCPPARVYSMLAYLADHYRDTAGYLHHIGLSKREIEQIRRKVILGL